jgi:hypothetical protein
MTNQSTVVWSVGGLFAGSMMLILFYFYRWKKGKVSVDSFKVFLTLVTTVATVVLAIAIIFQIVNYRNAQKEATIKAYSDLSQLFVDDILEIFVQYPSMDYYYNELVGIDRITFNTKRDVTLEHKISMLIFARLAKFTIVKQESLDEEHVTKISKWIGHVMDTFMKSEIFRGYWLEYKEKLSGPSTRTYMEETYNL